MRFENREHLYEYLEKIKRECSDIYSLYQRTSKYFYRGMSEDREYFEKIVPRKDRKPKDINIEIHKYLDEQFYKIFGWRPRTEGVFCTSDIVSTETYSSHAHIIFPKDGFKYIWSPEIDDLHSYLGPIKFEYSDLVLVTKKGHEAEEEEIRKKYKTKKEYVDFLNKKYKERTIQLLQETVLKYKEMDINKVLISGNEIMIKCNYYYAVHEFYSEELWDFMHNEDVNETS